MTLLPFGPVDVITISTLPISHNMRVVRRLLWWRHRRRRRRLLYRGHGRARRLGIRAASTIMARLVGVVDAVAVLRPVHDAHIMVSHSTRVLAVFIVARAAAVLHRCLRQRYGFAGVGSTGRGFAHGALRGVDVRSDGGRMWLRSASTAFVGLFLAARSKIELASRDTLAEKHLYHFPVDAVA